MTTPERIKRLRSRRTALAKEMRLVRADIRAAKTPNRFGEINYAPVASLRLRVQALRNDYDDTRLELADWEDLRGKVGKLQAEDYTADEWRAMILADAQACSDVDLQLYLHEALNRTGYSLVVEKSGALKLVRRAS
jgi:hypothetical protein